MGLPELSQRLDTVNRGVAKVNTGLRETAALSAGLQAPTSGAGGAGGAASPLDAEALAGIARRLDSIDEKVTGPNPATELRRFGE